MSPRQFVGRPAFAGWSGSHMRVGVPVIVPDLVSPCQLDRARFAPVRAINASRVTGFAYRIYAVHGINHEDPSGWSVTPTPVRDTYPERGAYALLAATGGAPLVSRVRLSVVHSSGAGRRTLSTGRSVQVRRMDEEARALPRKGGVRFGVYTSPMTTQAVSTTAAGTVGR